MSRDDHPYSTSAFSLVLFLVARGYTPLRAVASHSGGSVAYVFSPAARGEVDTYHELKDRLNRLALEARNTALTASPSHRASGASNDHVSQ